MHKVDRQQKLRARLTRKPVPTFSRRALKAARLLIQLLAGGTLVCAPYIMGRYGISVEIYVALFAAYAIGIIATGILIRRQERKS